MPLLARPKHTPSARDKVAIVALIAAAVYTVIHPTIWLTSFALLGIATSVVFRPHSFSRTLSVRGILLPITGYVALMIFVIVVVTINSPKSTSPRKNNNNDSDVDFDSIMDPVWRTAFDQYLGIVFGA